MPKPHLTTIPEWYHRYINQVEEDDLMLAIQNSSEQAFDVFTNLSADKWNYRYAEGKWSLKEMLQHIIDTERIFSYRALCIARGEKTSLPGFDEEAYATASRATNRRPQDLVDEFQTVRRSIEQLYASFDDEMLAMTGITNGNPTSVNAIGFMIPGHAKHHLQVIAERYF